MAPNNSIRYVRHKDIDRKSWDRRVEASTNGLIYARSTYLDALCRHWDAVIAGDYEAVMALPWRRKFYLRYLYAPAFIQQLGIIGKPDDLPVTLVLPLLAKRFVLGDVFFNFSNPVAGQLPVT